MNKNIFPLHSSVKKERFVSGSRTWQDYLEAEMLSPQHNSSNIKGQDIGGCRPAIILKEGGKFYQKKVHFSKRKKHLIIEDSHDEDIIKNSLSIAWQKNKTEPCQPRIFSFSSQKKTPLKEAFEVICPPKKYCKVLKDKSREEDSKCQLIQVLLRRYKDQWQSDQPEEVGSPCISSLKLKERIPFPSTNLKDTHLKFMGKRGCPLNRLSKQFLAQREKTQLKHRSFILKKQEKGSFFEISPWGTDEPI